jgi:hypothetical protein
MSDYVKHPPNPIARWNADTVAQMQDKGWEVIARCGRCRIDIAVNLDDLTKLRGGDFSLWNRHPVCRRIGCEGRVTFMARQGPRLDYRRLVEMVF